LNSSLSSSEAADVESEFEKGKLKILYVAPERFATERFRSSLKSVRISLFAIDEAHCVSQWGHDFRPEYRRLTFIPKQYQHVPRLALTATADERTRKEIISVMDLAKSQQFVSSFDRPNIFYEVVLKSDESSQLLSFISENFGDISGVSGIIYCGTRSKVEQASEF
jgi:ATP-dependent DNA helicase RecQ